jgi:hypothetical protein
MECILFSCFIYVMYFYVSKIKSIQFQCIINLVNFQNKKYPQKATLPRFEPITFQFFDKLLTNALKTSFVIFFIACYIYHIRCVKKRVIFNLQRVTLTRILISPSLLSVCPIGGAPSQHRSKLKKI